MKRQRKRRAHGPAAAIGSSHSSAKARQPGRVPLAQFSKSWPWLLGFLVLVGTFLAYLPALRGGFVWDDDSWTLKLSGLFQDISGLKFIWFEPTELQQYYPLTATTFWLDYQFWGFWTTPYHVENVLLHILAAVLFWRLLLRFRVPGAWLAAALFALHPVMVESAAWITERKNVLSLTLYLASLLAYLRYAEKSEPGDNVKRSGPESGKSKAKIGQRVSYIPPNIFYVLALVLFLGAMLSKTTAFSLPPVILLIAWWQRGRIRWRADVLPTLPFFALALSLCALTAWLEKNHVGAQGADFTLTFPQRCLIAGRVFWFYVGKILWPANLCFIYPRWQINSTVWWQWLYPVAAVGSVFALWLTRKRIGRGPLTALLFFVGSLFPVLGFMNPYATRFSFVCNHWVYLSSLGLLALVAALVVRAAEQLRLRGIIYGCVIFVLLVLGVRTWQEAGAYRDVETLWRTTLARNPDCWMAYNNLGTMLADQGKRDEAIDYFKRALQISPDNAEVQNNLGVELARQGKLDEAIACYERAVQLDPDYAKAHCNWGVAFALQGKLDEAIQHFERALQLKPDYAEALNNLGSALANQNQLDAAIRDFKEAVRINPNYADAHCHLAIALASQGKSTEAIEHFQQALAVATAQGNTTLADFIRAQLRAYQPNLSQPGKL